MKDKVLSFCHACWEFAADKKPRVQVSIKPRWRFRLCDTER